MAVHVVLGGLYLTLVPFQFVRRIRSRHLAYHRRVGRILVSIGLVVGVTALFMGLVIPFSGWGERVIIGLFGTLFLAALLKGFVHVRAGRVALHREWMIRAFAIALAVATIRLIYIPALLIVADPTDAQNALLWDTSFAVAFVREHFRGGALDPYHSQERRPKSTQGDSRMKALRLRGSGFDQAAPRGAPVDEQ